MRILVLGANGLLGSNVLATTRDRGWNVSGTYHSEPPAVDVPLHQLDITDTAAVREVVAETAPDWVVNCAAMTDVDACEEHPERAREVNAAAPKAIADLCASRSTPFLHVSTDYVFDGRSAERYSEDAPTNPLQEYGASKLAGERGVRTAHGDALITRLSFVYGIHRGTGELTGFPAWVRGRLLDGQRTPLFTDQHVTPTRAGQAADTFCELLAADETGTYHVAAQSCVTPYEFGAEIAHRLDADDDLLAEGAQSDVDRPAERPTHSCLDVSRVESVLNRPQPALGEDLDAIDGVFDATSGE